MYVEVAPQVVGALGQWGGARVDELGEEGCHVLNVLIKIGSKQSAELPIAICLLLTIIFTSLHLNPPIFHLPYKHFVRALDYFLFDGPLATTQNEQCGKS